MARVQTKEVTAAVAKLSNATLSAQRCRIVADIVRGQSLENANKALILEKKKAGRILLKLLRSATANAQQKGLADLDRLYVSELRVDEGPTTKRHMPRAQGRADLRLNRTSHIFIRLSEKQKASKKPVKKTAAVKASGAKKAAVKKKTTAKKTAAKKTTAKKAGDKK